MVSFPENAEEVPFRELPEGISSVQVADGITAIPDDAFWGCETLVDVTLPQTVRTIGKRAFGRCVNLARINIPEGVTYIGDGAFLMCGSLTQHTIPDSVTAIESDSFWNCDNLRLYVWDESYAQQYAREHRMDFFYILPDMGLVIDESDVLD